jgi:GxxExxY protein
MNKYTVGFKHVQLTEKIIGVFYEVYNELGFGFLESVYEQAMCIALRQAGLCVECQVPIKVYFRGVEVGFFKADMLVEGVILPAIKSARALEPAHESQLANELRATDIEVGLVLNFGPTPEVKRVAFDNEPKVRTKKYQPPAGTNDNQA